MRNVHDSAMRLATRRSRPFISIALLLAAMSHLPTGLAAQQQVWNESEIVEAVGVENRPNGIGRYFKANDGLECGVAAVMKTRSAVRMYESAGDVVATNPNKTAGIKIIAAEARDCLDAATKRLESLN